MSSLQLKVLSSMAVGPVLSELVALYRSVATRGVRTEAVGGVDVTKRVLAGEVVDVVVLADSAIEKLIAAGRLLVGSRVNLVKSGIAVAVKTGAPTPAIESEEAVKQAVLAAQTLSFSTGPSGVYLEKLFERWGILERIRERIVVASPGVPVGSLIADGSAELGFQQLSELKNVQGIHVLGPLPPAIQTITVFSGAIGTQCDSPEAARALLEYLASPRAAEVKQQHGMQAA